MSRRNTDWQDVPLPAGLAKRPKDARGFPITFVTLMEADGRPDFTTIDGAKILRCCTEALCGMCGEGWPGSEIRSDDHLFAFIGGPLCCENKNFLDPPMHVACAEYAMQVCPHIAISTSRYSKIDEDKLKTRHLFTGVHADRPERFGLYITGGFKVISYDGQPMFMTDDPLSITWNDQGVERV